jgi:hypothetical protein
MYFLAKDCFVCKIQEYWIILSVDRDKYLCVSHSDLSAVGRRLCGWADRCISTEDCAPWNLESDRLIESLAVNGIVTSNPNDGKPFLESACPACERATTLPPTDMPSTRNLFGIAWFSLACARVDWQLRRGKLSRTLDRIERRRRGIQPNTEIDALPLIAAFKKLRPFYPRQYLCLFDSLALLEYLARYRIFPLLVFGVVADPFQAHCWLQHGNAVLNDEFARVSKYKPILSL